jgi:hypothetical protein
MSKLGIIVYPERCPKCGGEIRATQELECYFHLEDGRFLMSFKGGDELVEVRFYCENDCPDPFTKEQIEALSQIGMEGWL